MWTRSAIGVLAICLLTACRSGPVVSSSASPPIRRSPLSLVALRTTDGGLALDNLQGQIDGEERLGRYGSLTTTQTAGIAELVAMRGQFLGRIADYERSDALAEHLVADVPNDGGAYLARAKARATFHRFADALDDLDRAERRGARPGAIINLRAAIFQATGRYDEALAIRLPAAEHRPDIGSLGALASLRSDRGEIEEAERLFTEAQYHYRDVSPFPVVWLYFQQGLMWMREGRLERARELFEAAHTRLPAYAAAQGHLAEVLAAQGQHERAIALLRPLAQSSDDPDYAAQLARICGEAGQAAEAQRWRALATARYDELVARHPEAFADHAAELWLGAGGDAHRAVALARGNLMLRPTPRAYELLLQASLAAGDAEAACAATAGARHVPHPWPGLQALMARASATCGRSTLG